MDSDSSDLSPQITLAAPAPAPAPNPNPNPSSLTLALPIQHPRIIPGGSNRDDCWSEAATSVLIDAWGERYLELNRGNLRQNHWKEVAEIVGRIEEEGKRVKTDVQCKNRIDTVKKKFKAEKAKAAATGVRSSWVFFDRMERLIGPGGGTTTPATTNNSKKGTMMAAKNNTPLVVAHSSESSGSKVPVGIPMGVRSMSVNKYNQELQQLQSQMKHQQNQMKQQQQQQRVMTPVLGRVEQPRFRGNFYDGNANKQPLRFGGFYDNVNREVFVRKRPPVESDSDSDSEEGDGSPDSMDGYPQEMYMRRKKPRVEFNENEVRQGRVERGGGVEKGHGKGWGESVRELTEAIVKFGEAYEQAESMKMQQIVEMEKQRMKFAKELELQRMKFLVKTQLELSQLSRNISRVGESNNHRVDNDNDDEKTNSDSSD
ncbi:hypothetical protein Droror1_Dr00006392 [Drosera rotundifolia]